MAELKISEKEIQEIESILLPEGSCFASDAKAVIRCWDSTDVAACPGSGKTTVLLAKLKILADKMPFNNGTGVCVLSHTNVAVDEIKRRLSNYTDKLFAYPNYIGTIQSFIDRFVTMPYIRKKFGRTVQPVSEQVFAEHLLRIIYSKHYKKLQFTVDNHFSSNPSLYGDKAIFINALWLDGSGNLCLKNQTKVIAGPDTESAKQFADAQNAVIVSDGLIRYRDTYPLACEAVASLRDEYTNLFSKRFPFVFIDEYQDCYDDQRDALNRLFDPSLCFVMRIGDPDQAIYNFQKDNMVDWVPNKGCLSIESSCRYPQEIADLLVPLRKGGIKIVSTIGNCGYKPVLIVFNEQTIDRVLNRFAVQLEKRGLNDLYGNYFAVGFIGKETVAGLRIGSYCEKYENANSTKNDYRYWAIIQDISELLQNGKLYQVENTVRKLICKLLHYAGIKDENTGKEFTPASIKELLKQKYNDIYTDNIIALSELQDISKNAVDDIIRRMVDALYQGNGNAIFNSLPTWFLDNSVVCRAAGTDNIYIDPIRGRRIKLCTIHSVKGQTHDATLFLETENRGGSDIARALWRYGIGKPGQSPIFEYSRKLVYVGFSRPKKLLCVAIQESTYEKCSKQFLDHYWEVVDIRQ